MFPRLLLCTALLLAGCSARLGPMPPPVPDPTNDLGGTCNAANAQFALGKTVDERLGEEARMRAGARLVRVLRPDRDKVDDARPSRLNLEVDDTGRIRKAYCG